MPASRSSASCSSAQSRTASSRWLRCARRLAWQFAARSHGPALHFPGFALKPMGNLASMRTGQASRPAPNSPSARAQAPFALDGAGECDDGAGARDAGAPWWVPVRFRTSSRGPASWTSLDACAPGPLDRD